MKQAAATEWLSWKLLMSTALIVGGCSAPVGDTGGPAGFGQASAPDLGGSNPATAPGPVRPYPNPGGRGSDQVGASDQLGKGGAGTPPTTPIPRPAPPPGGPGGIGGKTPRPNDAILQRGGGQARPRR
jgi:hypothetical protein